jgi:hypothetical protein
MLAEPKWNRWHAPNQTYHFLLFIRALSTDGKLIFSITQASKIRDISISCDSHIQIGLIPEAAGGRTQVFLSLVWEKAWSPSLVFLPPSSPSPLVRQKKEPLMHPEFRVSQICVKRLRKPHWFSCPQALHPLWWGKRKSPLCTLSSGFPRSVLRSRGPKSEPGGVS